MPHVSSGGGDDLGSTDEIKVYNDEGVGEEEKRSSAENLTEDKLGLVTESEEGKTSDGSGENYTGEGKGGPGSTDGKSSEPGPDRVGSLPFPLIAPYPYPNGATVPGFGHPSLASLYLYNNDRFASPPPAHMGIPPVHIDPKTGLPRSMYPLHPPPGQFPNPFYPDGFNWAGGGYPVTTSAFRGPYPPLSGSPLSRFSPPGLLPHHPGMPPGFHQAIITPGPKQEIDHNHRPLGGMENGHHFQPADKDQQQREKKKLPYVKKPLNAFMLFMREQRQKVIEECTLKESAAINQILGRKWHSLERSEQAKYYEMARKEKELHMEMYPGWSARDNYGCHSKKKKRKKPSSSDMDEASVSSSSHGAIHAGSSVGNNDCSSYEAKKCRARFGLDAQNQWCKPCRRKKKCIRALGLDEGDGGSDSEDGGNLSSLGHTTDGESLAGGSPRPDHLSAAVPSLYGSPVLPKSPLVVRPLLSPLVPPTTPPGTSMSGSNLNSPSRSSSAAARHLAMPSTPSSHSAAAVFPGSHLHSPSLLQHSPARRLHPVSSSSPSPLSSSMLLAT